MTIDLKQDPGPDPKTLWKAFATDMLAPYTSDRYRASLSGWVGARETRAQDGDDIRLSAFHLSDRLNGGSSLEAWGINRQMFISRDARILSVPYPRQKPALVAIWLNDFEHNTRPAIFSWAAREAERAGSGPTIVRENYFRLQPALDGGYVEDVCRTVRAKVPIAERAYNQRPFPSTSIRLATLNPTGKRSHRDGAGPDPAWGRVVIHNFYGKGSIYVVDSLGSDRQCDIAMPTGTTSSHIEATAEAPSNSDEMGAIMHRAGGDREGRGVIVLEGNRAPLPTQQSAGPWVIVEKGAAQGRGWRRGLRSFIPRLDLR